MLDVYLFKLVPDKCNAVDFICMVVAVLIGPDIIKMTNYVWVFL